jgi:hypothetical protein
MGENSEALFFNPGSDLIGYREAAVGILHVPCSQKVSVLLSILVFVAKTEAWALGG